MRFGPISRDGPRKDVFSGAENGIRTRDLFLTMEALCQLSYLGTTVGRSASAGWRMSYVGGQQGLSQKVGEVPSSGISPCVRGVFLSS